MTDPMHGEWERLDDGPLASAQMIQWYAPKTWHEIEQYWREKFGCEVDGEGDGEGEDLQRVVKTSPYWWFARWLIDLCDPNRSLGDPRWRPEYDQLAQYNAEKARGIMHTPEHAAAMTKLQDDFNRTYHATRHE